MRIWIQSSFASLSSNGLMNLQVKCIWLNDATASSRESIFPWLGLLVNTHSWLTFYYLARCSRKWYWNWHSVIRCYASCCPKIEMHRTHHGPQPYLHKGYLASFTRTQEFPHIITPNLVLSNAMKSLSLSGGDIHSLFPTKTNTFRQDSISCKFR